MTDPFDTAADSATAILRWIVRILHLTMGIGLGLALYERQWLNALAILAILGLMFVPGRFGTRFRVNIPPEFEALAIIFTYAALYLGETQGYYHRIWWWDIALHASAGGLLGIMGFLLLYVLNESEEIELHMQPRFQALFAFTFATAIGAIWEIFEFSMDRLFGANMQKPMFGDPSGLTDTMWDLIVDALGALAISLIGWWYMTNGKRAFFAAWIGKFVNRNPRLFRSPTAPRDSGLGPD